MVGYSLKIGEGMVKASGRDLDISPKKAIEICTYIRGRSLSQGKALLEKAIKMEAPIPLKRFTNGPGHKPGMGAGRYYVKACKEVLKVLKSAEANAKNKGFSTSKLYIMHLSTQRASTSWHHGRQKRSKIRTIHIETVLQESAEKIAGKKSSEKNLSAKNADKNVAKSEKIKKSESKDVKKAE